MIRASIAALLLATSAAAETDRIELAASEHNRHKTTIIIHAPTDPAAVATVSYHNIGVNNATNNGTRQIEWNGIAVSVTFEWNAGEGGADRIEVAPQPGYIAVPPSLTLAEETRGEIQIIRWEGM